LTPSLKDFVCGAQKSQKDFVCGAQKDFVCGASSCAIGSFVCASSCACRA